MDERQSIVLAANLDVEDIRRETFEGQGHLVLPAVLVQEQILRNNLGATFLPKEEIAASVDAWNDMPVTVRHPTKNGEPVSARTPDVSNAVRIGRIFNARMDDGKLKAEVWLSEKRMEDVQDADAIGLNVARGVINELSTGFTTKAVEMRGSYNGDGYEVVMTKLAPDHLALLVDEPGACSVADGCGLGVNMTDDEVTELSETFADRLMAFLRGSTGDTGAAASSEPDSVENAADNGDVNMERDAMIAALVERTEASADELAKLSDCALKALHGAPEPVEEPVEDSTNEADTSAEIAELKAVVQQLTAVVQPVVAERAENRSQMIDTLTKDARCAFDAEQLKQMSDDGLDALARTLGTNFSLRPAPKATKTAALNYKPSVAYWQTDAEVN